MHVDLTNNIYIYNFSSTILFVDENRHSYRYETPDNDRPFIPHLRRCSS